MNSYCTVRLPLNFSCAISNLIFIILWLWIILNIGLTHCVKVSADSLLLRDDGLEHSQKNNRVGPLTLWYIWLLLSFSSRAVVYYLDCWSFVLRVQISFFLSFLFTWYLSGSFFFPHLIRWSFLLCFFLLSSSTGLTAFSFF